jgi:pSer/pThr/pTyr-binding forkhead associated (FHA) protein
MAVAIDSKTAERAVRKPPFGAPHVYALASISGGDNTRIWRIVQADTVIGRGEQADIDVDDAEASKRHCMIRVNGPVCTVIDLGSLNGTLLNARILRARVAQRIRNLDEIQIGGTRLVFLGGRYRERGDD